jgi:hypothetical protein
MTVLDVSNRWRPDGVARWRGPDGVVHVVGPHYRHPQHIDVRTDCHQCIAHVEGEHNGFYGGDGSPFTTCLICLGASNFETYELRRR